MEYNTRDYVSERESSNKLPLCYPSEGRIELFDPQIEETQRLGSNTIEDIMDSILSFPKE